MSLATPASVPAGIIYLEELLDITENVPRSGPHTIDTANFDINSGTSWSTHAFQDDPTVPVISNEGHGSEVLAENLIPFLGFSNFDQKDLKELELELRFSGSQEWYARWPHTWSAKFLGAIDEEGPGEGCIEKAPVKNSKPVV